MIYVVISRGSRRGAKIFYVVLANPRMRGRTAPLDG